jgi:hypothetical protein
MRNTAAGQADIEFSGGMVFEHDTESPLRHNKKKFLDPWLVAVV